MTDRIEHHECPPEIALRLKLAGGVNRFGEPNFRVVWGFNRIVKNNGKWGTGEGLSYEAVKTVEEPKYLPADRWHLEMWRPPEEYGTPETWGKLGEEIVGVMTVDTAGPFPSRGEYELCYTLSSDLTETGEFVPLNGTTCELLVRAIRKSSPAHFTFAQRQAAIRQRALRQRDSRISTTVDSLLDARPAFFDKATSIGGKPKNHHIITN